MFVSVWTLSGIRLILLLLFSILSQGIRFRFVNQQLFGKLFTKSNPIAIPSIPPPIHLLLQLWFVFLWWFAGFEMRFNHDNCDTLWIGKNFTVNKPENLPSLPLKEANKQIIKKWKFDYFFFATRWIVSNLCIHIRLQVVSREFALTILPKFVFHCQSHFVYEKENEIKSMYSVVSIKLIIQKTELSLPTKNSDCHL